MSSEAFEQSRLTRRTGDRRPPGVRLLPEGPTVFILLLLVNLCAAMSVERGGWDHLIIPVSIVAGVAMMAGTIMARAGVLDSISHIVAVLLGATVSFILVLTRVEEFGPSLTSRVRPVFWHVHDWYFGNNNPQQNDDIVLSILLGLIVWMVAYLSAWVLFRRGWLLSALLMPALLLLVNLGYAPSPRSAFVIAFVLLCVPLAARYHLFRKQLAWSRLHIAGPRSLGVRFLSIGAVLAILVTSAGWNAPDSLSQETLQPLLGQLGQQVENARRNANEWLSQAEGRTGSGEGESSNRYSDFQDSFSIGGGLNLTDQPEVFVGSDSSQYLVAQHYNVYSGRGWSSNIEDTFDPNGKDGKRYAPAMSFRAGQRVILSDDASASRGMSLAEITPLSAMNGVMLTIDTYLVANIDSSVRMSWIQLDDAEFEVDSDDLSAIPPDLAQIVALLQSASLVGPDGSHGPMSEDDRLNEKLEDEQEALSDRFLDVRWQSDADGKVVSVFVTGQIPIYDDVESVYPRQDLPPNASYTVRGSASEATADELRQASTNLPDWVVQRYLQLPNTISARTSDLALDVTADAQTTYDKAKAVETYLRQNIVYDTTVQAPPDDEDVVDYLLFEDPRGYCEHYASAMTVMLRSLGIPARIVSGYAPGDFDPERGGYLYLQSNAHAWVEVFFPGYGWIPFEPTASEAPRTPGQDRPGGESPEQQEIEQAEPTASLETDEEVASEPTSDPSDPQMAAPIEQIDSGDNGGATPALFVGAILVSAVAVVGWWLWMRRLRNLPVSAGLFLRLLRFGRAVGVSRNVSTTPQEYADTLAQRIPVAGDYAQRIVYAYELDQYAERGSEGRVLESARQAWKRARAMVVPTLLRRMIPYRKKRQR